MSAAESQTAVPITPEGWSPKAGGDPLVRAKHGLIGAPVSRLDGALKVRGEAQFAGEYVMEGMVYAALRHSTIARGRITTLDTSAAEAAPGVVLVMTHRNAPRMQPRRCFSAHRRRPAAVTCPSCRTTASTGTASRSRSSWPTPRSSPTTPPR